MLGNQNCQAVQRVEKLGTVLPVLRSYVVVGGVQAETAWEVEKLWETSSQNSLGASVGTLTWAGSFKLVGD